MKRLYPPLLSTQMRPWCSSVMRWAMERPRPKLPSRLRAGSILLFGGLFGFAGMVLGVPVFAMFYSVVNRLVRYGLGKRKLPVETQEYLGRTGPLSRPKE